MTSKKNRWHPAFVDRDYIQLARKAREETDSEPEAGSADCPFGDSAGCLADCRECLARGKGSLTPDPSPENFTKEEP